MDKIKQHLAIRLGYLFGEGATINIATLIARLTMPKNSPRSAGPSLPHEVLWVLAHLFATSDEQSEPLYWSSN
ncbi:hypothetical protein ACFL2V_07295 [Pseudomonadota bacterium]